MRTSTCVAITLVVLMTGLPMASAANEFTLEAKDFDDGSFSVCQSGQSYADGPACILHGAGSPDQAEYVIEFPVAADYTLSVLYAAKDSRPVEISLDGKPVHTGCTGVTGSWKTKSARWEQQVVLPVERGVHTIALECAGAPPHICALRLQSSVPFPQGWKLKRLTSEQRAERLRRKTQAALAQTQRVALEGINIAAVQRAITDLTETFPGRYDGATHRQSLAGFATTRAEMLKSLAAGKAVEPVAIENLLSGVRGVLLANPLLDFDKLLVVRRNFAGQGARSVKGAAAGFVPMGFMTHMNIPKAGWDNEIMVLSGLRGTPQFASLFKAEKGHIVRDVRLGYSGEHVLFSSFDVNKRWAVYEMRLADKSVSQLTPTNYPDVDFFDACYLPNGKIVLCSTASYQGLPCLSGQIPVAGLYLLDPATKALRQLTFDQDTDNHPEVLNDGRVLYLRWEYSDIPHYFSRHLMSMNPDGTGQLAFYGSNGWFPGGFHFAKPIPNMASRVAGIIAGHHECGEYGRMAILDPELASRYPFRFRPESKTWGERELTPSPVPQPKGFTAATETPLVIVPEILPAEQTGFLQLVPGYGKAVAGIVCDMIFHDYYTKEKPELTMSSGGLPEADADFYRNVKRNAVLTTHPYPLSDKYFLVSQKNHDNDLWGLYLVDVFDNATLIAEIEGAALFEPVPLRARTPPPIIPERIQTDSAMADVHIADIYAGPGLQGVPRGTVKRLRVFSYYFGYNDKAGPGYVGIQSSWDIKRVIGTAKVEADGSAFFQIPANTPISIQPLDGEGRAIQLMRSWFVGMPGEHVSCVGCHENRATTTPMRRDLAGQRPAEALTPWFGAPRPFAFSHEVFPVLEKYCMSCHAAASVVGPRSKPAFRNPDEAYNTLHPYVHRSQTESDVNLLNPLEYHASTSLLIQLLEKGHHGVTLANMDDEARQRLYCWIDLNAPKNGSWNPPLKDNVNQPQRRCELAQKFANICTDSEAEYQAAESLFQARKVVPIVPAPDKVVTTDVVKVAGFPFSAQAAQKLQQADSGEVQRKIDLGNGVAMMLTKIPAGEFVMGSLTGAPDERPRAAVRIAKSFWMGVTEVDNAQYAAFDPAHDTRYVDTHGINRVTPGYIANHPRQPVARISWQEATQFCQWMSQKTGLKVTLPTEAQWEWAARAGTETQFFYGTMDADFGRFTNLADQSLRWFEVGWEGRGSLLQKRYPYPLNNNFPLRDERFRDHWFVVDYCGQTDANAWGLKDMVGNVSEWTRSSYRAYPYADDGRNDGNITERKVARGGSWANRPADAGSAVRRAYESWQKVYDVGFRVMVEEP